MKRFHVVMIVGLFLAGHSEAATFLVTNVLDSGAGSFRVAMNSAQVAAPGSDIRFSITGSPPFVINVPTIFPTITNRISILGETQPGYVTGAAPVIHFVWTGSPTNILFPGIDLWGAGSTVSAIRVSGFQYGILLDQNSGGKRARACWADDNGDGIAVGTANGSIVGGTNAVDRNVVTENTNGISVYAAGCQVLGNFAGVDWSTNVAGNVLAGILVYGGANNTIRGGSNYPQIVSGNNSNNIPGGSAGIRIQSLSAAGNRVEGCLIGTDGTGTKSIPNYTGVDILQGAGSNIIGGTNAAQRNIISGNQRHGVTVEGAGTTNNVIIGNYLGTDISGEKSLSNENGVVFFDASQNRVGGTNANERNVLSGNFNYGVLMQAGYATVWSNVVVGNYIGLSASATQVLGNVYGGVYLVDCDTNVVGGSGAGARNYICGNGSGVAIAGTNGYGNRVQGNTIGLDPSGNIVSNVNYGVEIFNAPGNEILGGPTANERNIISGNHYYGVRIAGAESRNNRVVGNFIGTDPSGFARRPNRYNGVDISFGAAFNIVGSTNPLLYNLISGNDSAGVTIHDADTHDNLIVGNVIGLDLSYGNLSNSSYGVYIYDAPSNSVGPANVIGYNYEGVYIASTGSAGNRIWGNLIGIDPANNSRSNIYHGIALSGARDTTIGGLAASNRNVISGNGYAGISIYGGSFNTLVAGNYIGTSTNGQAAVGNPGGGIIVDNSTNTQIGATNVAARNVISGNPSVGISIRDNATNVTVVNCYVGISAPGTNAVPNSSGIGIAANGMVLGTTNAQARNVISGNTGAGVSLDQVSGVRIINNHIGTTANGFSVLSNYYGLYLYHSSQNVIGGTNVSEGNVISGNTANNIFFLDDCDDNMIQGNRLGVSINGDQAVDGTLYASVNIQNSRGNLIGGTPVSARNTISGCPFGLILTGTGSVGNVVAGNVIGLNSIALGAIPNDNDGIVINNSPSNTIGPGNIIDANRVGIRIDSTTNAWASGNVIKGNVIGGYSGSLIPTVGNSNEAIIIVNSSYTMVGGISTADANIITFNGRGVVVVTNTPGAVAVGNAVLGNSIFSNGSPASVDIDLDFPGLTPNDVLDADVGPNNLQNFPVMTNAYRQGTFVHVEGYLPSAVSTKYRLEFFANHTAVAEGRTFINGTSVTTDSGGTGAFHAVMFYGGSTVKVVTATATAPNGDTSEFSVGPTNVPVLAVVDTDGDLIPDYWENLYGLNPLVSNTGVDTDGDGINDVSEYISDTPANNSNAFFRVTVISNLNARYVGFPSSPARTYDLQETTNLTTPGPWVMLVTNQLGNGTLLTLPDAATAEGRAYRAQVALP